MKRYRTNSPTKTKKLGELFAERLKKDSVKKGAVVLALFGDLGAGKTTFLQGFAKGLGIKDKITSPTFVIIKKFQIPPCLQPCLHRDKLQKNYSSFLMNWAKFTDFYHIDCYRLQKPKDILDLGFKEIIKNPKNIVAIEWPERIKSKLPKQAIILRLVFKNEKVREIFVGAD